MDVTASRSGGWLSRGRATAALAVGVLALGLAGCSSSGGKGGDAAALLQQTFDVGHSVSSGVVDAELTVVPSGSSIINGPLTVSVKGPFTAIPPAGTAGRKRQSFDLTAEFAGLSMRTQARVISTGSAGYMTVSGQSYRLPSDRYQLLTGRRTNPTAVENAATMATTAALEADWRSWLIDPAVIGRETVDGVPAEHIRGQIELAPMLRDAMRIQRRELRQQKLTTHVAKRPKAMTAAEIAQLGSEIGSPSFDVWAGVSDHILRRLSLSFVVKLDGSLASVTSAAVTLVISYSDINQPQSITAPTQLAPYSQLERKLDPLLDELLGPSRLAALTAG